MVGIAVLVLVGVALVVAALASRHEDGPSTIPTTSALGRRVRALTDEGVLTAEQAAQLWQAAQQDGGPAGDAGGAATPTAASRGAEGRDGASTSSLGVLDVLGYVGGALLLGALIFVGFTLWGDLSRGWKTALAIASFVAPVAGGVVLEWSRTRRGLARVLLALGCFAAGFACFVIIDDQDLMISAGVVVVAAVVGLITLRSAAFYVPGWVGAMGFVPAFVQNGLGLPEGDALGYWIAGGFLLVGLAAGRGRDLPGPAGCLDPGGSEWLGGDDPPGLLRPQLPCVGRCDPGGRQPCSWGSSGSRRTPSPSWAA